MSCLTKTKNNMKKIIRLTESDLVRLVKRAINEKRFTNQVEVDKILDKISSQGINSLTSREKKILDNPDLVSDEPDRGERFYFLYENIINDLKKIYNDFVELWPTIKNSPEKKHYIQMIQSTLESITVGIDELEEIGPDSDEVYECNELYIETVNKFNKLFNE